MHALMHKDMSKAKKWDQLHEHQKKMKIKEIFGLNENSILFIFDWLCDIAAAAAVAADRPKCIEIQKTNMIGTQ